MFKFTFYTLHQLETLDTIRTLWTQLLDVVVTPTHYDINEDARIPLSPDSYKHARELYTQGGFLFVTGGREGFHAMFARQPHGLSTWHLWVKHQAVKTGAAADWIQWLFRLCSSLPVLFGAGCDETEFDAKHSFLQELPGGRRVSGSVGASLADFYRFLPGIYWLTIFGKQLVEDVGENAFSKLTSAQAIPLRSSQMALLLKAEAQPADITERLKLTRSIAETLGANHFFDKDSSLATLRQYPGLSRLLEAAGHDRLERA